MKEEVVLYRKIYEILKNKIESGLIPEGAKLPSRADLCKEFAASEKPVRRAVKLLENEGLIEITKRKRPVVAFNYAAAHRNAEQTLKRADAVAADDILKTGVLLCYPLTAHGLSLCRGMDWDIPETIISKMNPERPSEFWTLSNKLWRFFISRNENELILRTVDSLSLSEVKPMSGSSEIREKYLNSLKELIGTVKSGGNPEAVHFDDLSTLYKEKGIPNYEVREDSPLRVGVVNLDRKLYGARERYSSVCLDIIGLIAVGRYKPGERLPSHQELCRNYGVSIDTTIKAVGLLQKWGVADAVRGKGIFVTTDLEGLKKLSLPGELIAGHVRRYLDSLELLSLTAEGVAAYAAARVRKEEAHCLAEQMDRAWNEEYLYGLSPRILLDFIVEHIQYNSLKTIYEEAIQRNYSNGKSIPNLVHKEKQQKDCEIHEECMAAAVILAEGDAQGFARKAAEVFQHIHHLVAGECRRLGYMDAAMKVYDGSLLWK